MFNSKNIFFIYLPLLVSFIYSVLLILSIKNYNGNLILYFLYHLLILYFFLFSFIKSELFFDKFLSSFILLGFGVKLTLSFYLMGHLSEVSNYLTKDMNLPFNCHFISKCLPAKNALVFNGYFYDNGLVVVVVALLALILTSLVVNILFKPKFYSINTNLKTNSKYNNNRKLIISLFLILSLSVSLINYNLGIYQKGINSNFLFKPIFTWLISFGLISFFSCIIYLEIIKKTKGLFFIICISFILIFINNVSSLSRSMIFNSASIFLAFIKIKPNFNPLRVTIVLSTLLLLFIGSLIVSKELRANKYESNELNSLNSKNILEKNKTSIYDLNFILKKSKSFVKYVEHIFIYRWVGITEVIKIAYREDNNNFELFKLFLFEKTNGKISLYDKLITKNYSNIDRDKFNFTSAPGLVAFLYISGNLYVVFFGIIFIYLFCTLIENLTFFLSKQNIFLTSLISQTLAYRLIHFGVNTSQIYKYIFAIIFTILLVSLTTRFYLKK